MIQTPMRIFVFVVVSLTLVGAFSLTTVSAQSPPSPPTVLAGTAWLDGQLVPPGTVIQAMQGDMELSHVKARNNGRFGPLKVKQPGGSVRFTSW